MAGGGTGTGLAQDATGQALLAKLGMMTPKGGTGTGLLQDSTMQALLGAIATPLPQRLSANANVIASQVGTTFYCNTTTAAFTVTIAMSGMPDGAEFTFIDDHAQWSTHALSVTTDAGTVPIVDPALIGTTGGTSTTVVLSEIRASVTFKYDSVQNMFLVK